MRRLTRYPSYDVMNERDEWDQHTQKIVASRLYTSGEFRFLTVIEAETLRSWCGVLMDDERPEIIQFVLDHIDQTLLKGKESQRKPGELPAPELVRSGLYALDHACQLVHTRRFFHLPEGVKRQLVQEVSRGEAEPYDSWKSVPQQTWFQKLLTLSIEAYYSHPEIWSEIGYGGPAYPRGYVRMHPGQLDPWEAKEEESSS